jgi:AcrR family transcriptional regulator
VTRQERAERTRTAILDAAAEVIEERGFTGASLSDILARAGVTKGALYFHFSSKEELAHALITEQFNVGQAAPDLKTVGLQTAIDLCHDMAHNLLTSVRIRASVRLVVETGSFSNPTPEAYERWIAVVREYMVAAKERGDLRQDMDPDRVAHWVVGAFLGIQIQSQVLTGRADVHERVTEMWRIALPGLVPPRRVSRFSPSGSVTYVAESASA